MGSDSARSLHEKLRNVAGVPVHKTHNINDVRDGDLVLFWGNKDSPAANKLRFFKAASRYEDINIPEFTTDKEAAKLWCRDGHEVFARQRLTGHSGEGIVTCLDKQEAFPDAPLYVKYKKKTSEFRAHVFNGKVIDIVQKKKRADWENYNNQIRNLAGGWVYCRADITIPHKNDLIQQAILACTVSNLDFGAVDLIYNAKEKKHYVLEVNTAPGLEGQTVDIYADAIKLYMDEANG